MRAAFILLVLLISPPLVFGQINPGSGTGVKGVITIAPVHGGPSRPGVASSSPLPDTTFVARNDREEEKSFTTDAQGHFQIALAPGHYTVWRKGRTPAVGSYGPFEVTVKAGEMTEVTWRCDTGMR